MRCARCRQELPEGAFYASQPYVCKQCVKAYQKAWRRDGGKVVPSGECCGTCRSYSRASTGGWCMKLSKSMRVGGVCPAWRAMPRRDGRYEEVVKPINVFNKPWE